MMRKCFEQILLLILSMNHVNLSNWKRKSLLHKVAGKRLNAAPFQVLQVHDNRECLGFCIHDERCKSFNFYHKNSTCALFVFTYCDFDTPLIADKDVDHFDTNYTNACPCEYCLHFSLIDAIKKIC